MMSIFRRVALLALLGLALCLPASANTTFTSLYSPIKSIQTGTIAMSSAQTTNTATITSVNTAKAYVIFNGQQGNGNIAGAVQTDLTLTNATTVTVTRDNTGSATIATVTYFTVLEFN